MTIIKNLLTASQLVDIQSKLASASWPTHDQTAGQQSALVKHNQQLPHDDPSSLHCAHIVQQALAANATFISAALPRKIFPPLFNRYAGERNHFGDHIDNAIRTQVEIHTKQVKHVRTDLSATLFLTNPAQYDGGELIIQHVLGEQRVKLAAGDMILYPASTVHRVEPVTRGARLASFFWVESMVQRDDQRLLLYDLDLTISALRQGHGEITEAVKLTGTYHNLLRMWGQT
jgi:PKHD-type hydroxylase